MAALKVPTIFTAIDKYSSVVAAMSNITTRFATKAQTAFAYASRGARSFISTADSLQSKIFNLQNAAGVLFAGMAIRKGFEIVTNAAEAGDEIQKTSSIIGISTKSLQELSFAAKRENVSNELLTGSFLKMNKAVGSLQKGSGPLYASLKKSNPVLLNQLKNVKSSEEAFNLLSAAVQKAPNPMQKAAIAAAAFGRGGIEMMKLIEIGPDGIQKLRNEAQQLGIVMSEDMINGAAQFADAQDNMNAAMMGLKVTIAGNLLPILQKGIEKLTNWVVKNRDVIKAKTAEFFDKIASAARFLFDNLDTIVNVGSKLIKVFAAIWIFSKLLQAGLLAVSIVTGTVNAVMWLYTAAQVAAGTATATSGAMAFAANVMYGLYVAGVVIATAATSAFTAVLAFVTSPIALIILAIGALIAVIVVIVKYWNQFGAAATAALALVAAPLAFALSLIQSLRRNWEMVKTAFKTEGIIGGLKAIGVTILDAILMPLQQVFHLLAKLPKSLGGGMFASAETKLMSFRTGLGANTTTDENGNSLAPAPAINTKKTNQDAIVSRTETSSNKNVTFDFKNVPKGLQISGNGVSSGNLPNLGSTFGM